MKLKIVYFSVYPLIPDHDFIFLYSFIVFGCQPFQSNLFISYLVWFGKTILAYLFVLFIFKNITALFSIICFYNILWSEINRTPVWNITSKSIPMWVILFFPEHIKLDRNFIRFKNFAGLKIFLYRFILGIGLI